MKVKMKRKGIGIVLTAAAILLMAGCTGNAGNSGNTGNTANIAGTSEQPSAVYVPVDTDATSDNTMNVVEGAYINSFASGYISQNEKPEPYNMYLITTEEEVEYAEDRLGMKAPEDEDELWAFSVNVADAFQTMKETCPRDALKGNEVPLCLIHGAADTLIPPENSDELAAATAGYKEVHKVEGADHACSRHVLGEEAYTEIVGAFLRNIT